MTRVGLAIGCGGTIGGAWAIAALSALATELEWDPRTATVLQGTSAGSEIVTMLAGGYSAEDLAEMQAGRSVNDVLRRHIEAVPKSFPPLPFPAFTHLGTVRHRGAGGHAAIAGLAPRGRGDTTFLRELADDIAGPDGWLPHPGARLVAFEPATGTRTAFGALGAPKVAAHEALRASWSVPGWMPPVTIGGRTFLDGGVASTASVDLIDPTEIDVLYVIAPMASAPGVRGRGIGGRLEQLTLRRPMSAVLDREIAVARESGLRVVPILPDADDLSALGCNFMSREHRATAFADAIETSRRTVTRALYAEEVMS
ncbi:patatin-like phospholipase family protein [Rhodococcus sp. G-MC3]|uniref:patatin-like phospholipase family protein n=1 Tax=Rhodococcus sp. G-MC3 TaxID=3046209 RepID=UPI0024BAC73D|nr:patatin-like phospholipase family protein [Rhodococcus sp. G-MC3]MDJ0392452.1 patatin-like phospholipase family protein [Rhodococcus sp. G-MC3]